MPVKPTDTEEEYFARQELARMREAERRREENLAQDELRRQKELHFMKCPKCGMELKEIELRGAKVDTCSACAGIWLDSGEVELLMQWEPSLIQRVFSVFQPAPPKTRGG